MFLQGRQDCQISKSGSCQVPFFASFEVFADKSFIVPRAAWFVVEDLVASVREPEAEAEAVLDPVILAQREFKATHSNIKHRWILPENFPSDAVIMVRWSALLPVS